MLTPGNDLSWPAWQLMLDSPGLADELSVSYANPSPLAAAAKDAGTAQPCLGAALAAGGMAAAVVQHTANVGIEHQTCGAPCGCTRWWLLDPGAHVVRRVSCIFFHNMHKPMMDYQYVVLVCDKGARECSPPEQVLR